MSKREQIRKLRLRIKQMQGDPISDAIARVMDELSTGHEQPKNLFNACSACRTG